MNQSELVDRYRRGATSGHASNMFIDGDTLYSYGRHFPLVIRLDGGGHLVNGDRYSVTTSQHQSQCFDLGPQVPFSALTAAGVSERERFPLEVVDAARDRREWVCRCPSESHTYPYDCADGYERHTLGGTLLRHGRRYLLSAIDFETGVSHRLLYFLCLLPGKVATIAEAYESLVPAPVKIARALGAETRRQGDFFFVRSTLPTRTLARNGYERISESVWRGFDRALVQGYALDARKSHLATELREHAGVRYARGTVRHVPGEHRMVKLGRDWWGAFQNMAKASWAATGNVD